MTDKIIYKDFIGTVHFSSKDVLFYGKIDGIDDLVTFEGQSVEELKSAFEEAVEDYIQLCEEAGKKPGKSFKGSFNIRIDPQLHSRASKLATLKGKTLNQFIKEAIEKEVNSFSG